MEVDASAPAAAASAAAADEQRNIMTESDTDADAAAAEVAAAVTAAVAGVVAGAGMAQTPTTPPAPVALPPDGMLLVQLLQPTPDGVTLTAPAAAPVAVRHHAPGPGLSTTLTTSPAAPPAPAAKRARRVSSAGVAAATAAAAGVVPVEAAAPTTAVVVVRKAGGRGGRAAAAADAEDWEWGSALGSSDEEGGGQRRTRRRSSRAAAYGGAVGGGGGGGDNQRSREPRLSEFVMALWTAVDEGTRKRPPVTKWTPNGFVALNPSGLWRGLAAAEKCSSLYDTFMRQLSHYSFEWVAYGDAGTATRRQQWESSTLPVAYDQVEGKFHAGSTPDDLASMRPRTAPRATRGHHPSECRKYGRQDTCDRCLAILAAHARLASNSATVPSAQAVTAEMRRITTGAGSTAPRRLSAPAAAAQTGGVPTTTGTAASRAERKRNARRVRDRARRLAARTGSGGSSGGGVLLGGEYSDDDDDDDDEDDGRSDAEDLVEEGGGSRYDMPRRRPVASLSRTGLLRPADAPPFHEEDLDGSDGGEDTLGSPNTAYRHAAATLASLRAGRSGGGSGGGGGSGWEGGGLDSRVARSMRHDAQPGGGSSSGSRHPPGVVAPQPSRRLLRSMAQATRLLPPLSPSLIIPDVRTTALVAALAHAAAASAGAGSGGGSGSGSGLGSLRGTPGTAPDIAAMEDDDGGAATRSAGVPQPLGVASVGGAASALATPTGQLLPLLGASPYGGRTMLVQASPASIAAFIAAASASAHPDEYMATGGVHSLSSMLPTAEDASALSSLSRVAAAAAVEANKANGGGGGGGGGGSGTVDSADAVYLASPFSTFGSVRTAPGSGGAPRLRLGSGGGGGGGGVSSGVGSGTTRSAVGSAGAFSNSGKASTSLGSASTTSFRRPVALMDPEPKAAEPKAAPVATPAARKATGGPATTRSSAPAALSPTAGVVLAMAAAPAAAASAAAVQRGANDTMPAAGAPPQRQRRRSHSSGAAAAAAAPAPAAAALALAPPPPPATVPVPAPPPAPAPATPAHPPSRGMPTSAGGISVTPPPPPPASPPRQRAPRSRSKAPSGGSGGGKRTAAAGEEGEVERGEVVTSAARDRPEVDAGGKPILFTKSGRPMKKRGRRSRAELEAEAQRAEAERVAAEAAAAAAEEAAAAAAAATAAAAAAAVSAAATATPVGGGSSSGGGGDGGGGSGGGGGGGSGGGGEEDSIRRSGRSRNASTRAREARTSDAWLVAAGIRRPRAAPTFTADGSPAAPTPKRARGTSSAASSALHTADEEEV